MSCSCSACLPWSSSLPWLLSLASKQEFGDENDAVLQPDALDRVVAIERTE